MRSTERQTRLLRQLFEELLSQRSADRDAARMTALQTGLASPRESVAVLMDLLETQANRAGAYEQELARLRREIEERDQQSAPVAIFHGMVPGRAGERRAEVSLRGQHLCLPVLERLSEPLPVGHRVELSPDRNCVIGLLGPFRGGSIAELQAVRNGTLQIVDRGAELVLQRSAELAEAPLVRGDRVRYDEESRIAYECFASAGPAAGRSVEPVRREEIAGYRRELARIERAVDLALDRQLDALKRAYRVGDQRVFVLVGPPGTGKSMLMKYAATHAATRLGLAPELFGELVVVIDDLLDKYVGESNRKLRRCLDAARDACRRHGLGILLADDADRMFGNRARRATSHQVNEELTMELCKELSGLYRTAEGALLVALSTNHLENLDPALWRGGRAQVITVGLPDRLTRERILEVHLAGRAVAGRWGDATQAARALSCALSDYLSGPEFEALLEVQTADGKKTRYGAADLLVGADLAAVVEQAAEEALFRDAAAGKPPGGLDLPLLQDTARSYLTHRARNLGEGVRRFVPALREAPIRGIRALV